MTKYKFIGVPGEQHDSISQFGLEFPLNKWVDVNDRRQDLKLKDHPHFVAQGDKSDPTDVEIKRELAVADIEQDYRQQLADENNGVHSAEDFNRRVDTPISPVAVDPESIQSADEFNRVQDGVAYGNADGSGDTDAAEDAGSGNRRAAKRGRPRKDA